VYRHLHFFKTTKVLICQQIKSKEFRATYRNLTLGIKGTISERRLPMNRFDDLVSEQLKTMDKLLFIQSEIERCQKLEAELQELEKETELLAIKAEINNMKLELQQIHKIFEEQTEEVVRTYQQKIQPIA